MNKLLIWPVLAIFLFGPMAKPSLAHPFHISLAEVELDARTKRLQVSLKVHSLDFDAALSKLAGRKIDVEKSPDEARPWIAKYLNQHFYLTRPDADAAPKNEEPNVVASDTTSDLVSDAETSDAKNDSKSKLGLAPRSRVEFVGQELKGTWLWLYFEIELPQGLGTPGEDDLQMVNSVLCEAVEGQINTTSVRHAGQRFSLKTTGREPVAIFKKQWLQTP